MEPFNAIEARIVGCLIEKEITTPDYYPLTLNALVLACNQKSNRHPVVEFDDAIVLKAVDHLKIRTLVMSVYPSGSRAAKYKHVLREKMDFLDDELAIVGELLLRGPQTVGELRTRCERMYPFASTDDVRDVLVRLSRRQVPLTRELPRQPGHKESRWAHLFCGEPELPAEGEYAGAREPVRVTIEAENARIDALASEVADLRRQLQELQQTFDAFRAQFG